MTEFVANFVWNAVSWLARWAAALVGELVLHTVFEVVMRGAGWLVTSAPTLLRGGVAFLVTSAPGLGRDVVPNGPTVQRREASSPP